MGRKATWEKQIAVSKDEAILAIKLFNDPTDARPFEHFIVHMQMAYLYLMQAEALQLGVEIRIPLRPGSKRFQRVDGEYRTKDLQTLASSRFDQASPVLANIRFFAALRNKIEHRAPKDVDALTIGLAGNIQAYLVNYEQLLVQVAGHQNSLAKVLRFPLFIGGFTEDSKTQLANLTKVLPADLRTFVADFSESLPRGVRDDSRFSLPLKVALSKTNRNGHLSMNFVEAGDLPSGSVPGPDAYLISRNVEVQVDGAGEFKPTDVVARVRENIPFTFSMSDFTNSYKHMRIRPENNAKEPELTNLKFCTWNSTFRQYAYTQAFVDLLIDSCQTVEGFAAIVGRPPKDQLGLLAAKGEKNYK